MGSIGGAFDRFDVIFDGWVETGTHGGAGADWLADHVHPTGVTMDLRDVAYRRDGVLYLVGDSAVLLPQVLTTLTGTQAFWLDAHYPVLYGDVSGTTLPLQAELDAIRDWVEQDPTGHVAYIWADDAWIYHYPCSRTDPFPPQYPQGALDLSRWHDYALRVDPTSEGVLVLSPPLRETP